MTAWAAALGVAVPLVAAPASLLVPSGRERSRALFTVAVMLVTLGVAAWAFTGDGQEPVLHKEDLEFDNVPLAQRSYK